MSDTVLGDRTQIVETVETVVTNTEINPEAQRKIKELENEVKALKEQLEIRETCRRCGRVLGSSPLTVTDDAAEEYFRCLLGQRPYEKTFKMFDGQLLLTFRELSGTSVVENSKQAKEAEGIDDYEDLMEMYLLTGMLVRVETYDPNTMITTTIYSMTDEQLLENAKNPRQAYNNLLECVGQIKIAVIRRACSAFEYLLTALIERGQDPNFYADAGLL